MSVIELLTDSDKEAIKNYIELYGMNQDGDSVSYSMEKPWSYMASVDHILRVWNMNKSLYLNKIFGNTLIKKIPIEYGLSPNEVDFTVLHNSQFAQAFAKRCSNGVRGFWWDSDFSTLQKDANYISEYDSQNRCLNNSSENNTTSPFCHKLHNLLYDETYAFNNIFDGDTFSISVRDKKPLKIPHGAKWSKILGKVAQYLDLDMDAYERWRQKHSQLINTKTVKGNLCLSIHPLDYMTMSDATFSSCMNWMHTGGYRRGTVETMNSPNVVVAYLESDGDNLHWGKYKWNLKKWRTLVIVTPEFVCSVKGYPYDHHQLSIASIEALSQMMETNLNIQFTNEISDFNTDYWSWIPHNEDMIPDKRLEFMCSGAMYCDFGTTTHFIKTSTKFDFSQTQVCDYSGPSECMFCGEASDDRYDFDDESCVLCRDCMTSHDESELCCDICGSWVSQDDVIYDENEYVYCSICAESRLVHCVCCDQWTANANARPIILSYKGINAHPAPEKLKTWAYSYIKDDTNNNGICTDCLMDLWYDKFHGKTEYCQKFNTAFDNLDIVGQEDISTRTDLSSADVYGLVIKIDTMGDDLRVKKAKTDHWWCWSTPLDPLHFHYDFGFKDSDYDWEEVGQYIYDGQLFTEDSEATTDEEDIVEMLRNDEHVNCTK